jgi:hypothetical protein
MINWSLLVCKLRKVKSLRAISKELGIKQDHLTRLARGDVAEPKFSNAVKLLDYYYDNVSTDMKEFLL